MLNFKKKQKKNAAEKTLQEKIFLCVSQVFALFFYCFAV